MTTMTSPPMITLCLVLRDNLGLVRSFLEDIKGHVNEIVVVDLSPDHRAAGIVRRYTDRVFVKTGQETRETNLQFGIDQARCPWILILDVRERLDAALKKGLRQLVHSGHDAYWIAVMDVKPDGTISSDRREYALRFFRKGQATFPGPHKDPRIHTERVGKVEGATILRLPGTDACPAAREIPADDRAMEIPGSKIARLKRTLRSGRGEETLDLGLLLEQLEKEAPVMDTEEAFIRFLHELSKE